MIKKVRRHYRKDLHTTSDTNTCCMDNNNNNNKSKEEMNVYNNFSAVSYNIIEYHYREAHCPFRTATTLGRVLAIQYTIEYRF